jgi:hypothetical protein
MNPKCEQNIKDLMEQEQREINALHDEIKYLKGSTNDASRNRELLSKYHFLLFDHIIELKHKRQMMLGTLTQLLQQ